jgi:hypothetical protein
MATNETLVAAPLTSLITTKTGKSTRGLVVSSGASPKMMLETALPMTPNMLARQTPIRATIHVTRAADRSSPMGSQPTSTPTCAGEMPHSAAARGTKGATSDMFMYIVANTA